MALMQQISLAVLSRPKCIDCGPLCSAGNLLYQWPSWVCQPVHDDKDAVHLLDVLQKAAKPERNAFVSSRFKATERHSEWETLSDTSQA